MILGKAIELLGQLPSAEPVGIPQLVSLLDDQDPDLVSAIGKLDTKHFHGLVENLETLRGAEPTAETGSAQVAS